MFDSFLNIIPAGSKTIQNQFFNVTIIWDKVFKRGVSKFCERQSLKNLVHS